jgi:hypothetical protein
VDAATRFRALFDAHVGAVRRYACHRSIPDADDLVAEVFTVAWRRLDDVPVDDPLPWLLGVAGNVGLLDLGYASSTPGTLTGLDVWVDRDDVVRGVDLHMRGVTSSVRTVDNQPRSVQVPEDVDATVRFHDIGVPNTIERPADVRD